MSKREKTVGQVSLDLVSKTPETLSPIEQMRESLTEYDKNINECIETNKKIYAGDFFIVVITKKEPLMENVLRNYFMARSTCPTPDYDQTVYRYDKKAGDIEFIWTIPSKHTCLTFIENKDEIVPDEWGLLKFILEFADGTLYKKAKELNGEEEKSNLIIS